MKKNYERYSQPKRTKAFKAVKRIMEKQIMDMEHADVDSDDDEEPEIAKLPAAHRNLETKRAQKALAVLDSDELTLLKGPMPYDWERFGLPYLVDGSKDAQNYVTAFACPLNMGHTVFCRMVKQHGHYDHYLTYEDFMFFEKEADAVMYRLREASPTA